MLILVANHSGVVRWSYDPGIIKRLAGRLEARKVWELVEDLDTSTLLKQEFAIASALGEKREFHIVLPDAPWHPDETTVIIEPVEQMVVATLRRSFSQFNITKRERDVLQLICEGMSGSEISNALNICHTTVETHRTRLYEKTGCSGTASLVRWAARNRLIEP
ncbi:MAG TPA: LuxR C-terminal-related transcriptional regulator [Pirellulales bacterium]|nr:LuxR C-terminal-related transcriptional regulator [Pirellulales bacterium]